jgi:hypothetical protein
MSEDVSSKVKKIVADHLGIDEAKVTEESSFIDDLGWVPFCGVFYQEISSERALCAELMVVKRL